MQILCVLHQKAENHYLDKEKQKKEREKRKRKILLPRSHESYVATKWNVIIIHNCRHDSVIQRFRANELTPRFGTKTETENTH